MNNLHVSVDMPCTVYVTCRLDNSARLRSTGMGRPHKESEFF